MKTRKKKTEAKPKRDESTPPSANRGGEIRICHRGAFPMVARFHDLPTTELVVIENRDELLIDDGSSFAGKFVKVSMILKASEAHTFNGAAIREELERAGARAVVMAPRIVPDSRTVRNEEEVKSKTIHELVDYWFGEQKIDDDERLIGKNLILGFMESEGL